MQEEKGLQTKILKDLRSLGKYCVAFKIMKTSDNKIPDIFFSTALTGGIFIETKKPKGPIAKGQTTMIHKLSVCGCQSFPCYNWEEWWDIKKSLGLLDGEYLLDRESLIEAHERNKKMLS